MVNKILLVCFFIPLGLTDCEYNFLISKSYQTNLTYCITDSDYAMSWITTDLGEIPQQVSRYIPEPSKKGKLSHSSTTVEAWFLKRYMANQEILDQRWEEFPVITVKNKGLKLLRSNLTENFEIYFSVRTDDAGIYLCKGSVLSASNCYSMILKNENNITKVIKRECPANDVSCVSEDVVSLPILPHTYISINYWSHFYLCKENNQIILWYDRGEEFCAIVSFTSLHNGSGIDVTHLIVNSESEKSFWKIHEREFLYTFTNESNLFWDDLSVTAENRRICLSFSVSLCNSCQFEFTLRRKHDIVNTEFVGEITPFQWTDKYYHSDDLPIGNYTLSLSTVAVDTSWTYFWAIDGMRECRNNGFRILQSNKETKCQLMSGQKNVISMENSIFTESVGENYCSNNAFDVGHTCVPLRWLYDSEDDGIQICSIRKNTTICYYKKGYRKFNSSLIFGVFFGVFVLVTGTGLALGLATYFCYRKRCCKRREIKSNETLLHNFEDSRKREIVTYERKQNTTIPVVDFMGYVKNCENNRELEKQYKAVIDDYSLRVQYEEMKKGEYFDYVDMVYTKGKTVRKSYIATELLSENVAKDFWKIVWNDNVQHIVLQKDYSRNESKQYWLENGDKMQCDEVSVQLIFSKALENFHYRKFILTREDVVKEVEHVQFPYNGTNHRKYVPLFKRIQKFTLTPNQPILVHSSDGIERVGLILLCDMSLRMAEEENVIDVWKNLQELARHNIDLAGNIVQYQFAHSIISEYFANENYYEDPEQVYLNY